MLNLRAKRGITNIEMIIAATLFIFSVVIVIYYISFISIREEPADLFLSALEQKLRDESEINCRQIYLTVSNQPAACFNISLHSDMASNENFSLIKDIEGGTGTAVRFNVSGDRLLLEKKESSQGLLHYVIYSFSSDVTKTARLSNVLCTLLSEGAGYNYSISREIRVFAKANLIELSSYNYNDLKKRWEFSKDFAINITNSSDHVLFSVSGIKALQAPQVQVKAKEFPIKLIDEEGIISEAMVNIRVW